MKKTIVVSIVDGVLFSECPECHSVFRWREIHRGSQLTDISELHFIELGKIQERMPAKLTPLEQFGAYIKFATDEKKVDFVQKLIAQGEEVITLTEQSDRRSNGAAAEPGTESLIRMSSVSVSSLV